MEKFKKIVLNTLKCPFFLVAMLFLFVIFCYSLTMDINQLITKPERYDFDFAKAVLGPLLLAILGISFGILFFQKKLDSKYIFIFIILLGIILRLIYGIDNRINERQHDVGDVRGTGHYGYTFYIFRYLKLPNTNADQFYQPPLNSIIQALWMRLSAFFNPCPENIKDSYIALFNTTDSIRSSQTELTSYIDTLYSSTKILSIFYSCVTLITIHYILKEFNLENIYHNLILLFMSIQPMMVMMAGTMNNDNLSYMFFFLSLLCFIKFIKKSSFGYAVLLALSIGCGMITKLSIGLIAIIYGPIMIYKLIKLIMNCIKGTDNKKSVLFYILQLIVFGIIVFPLGLSYAIRNYVKFNQEFTYILDFGRNSWLHSNIKDKTIVQRFISLPFSQLIHHERGIYHDYYEYNIWVDLIKTSIFEEFSYGTIPSYPGTLMFICNIIICFSVIIALIYTIVKLLIKQYTQNKYLAMLAISITLLGLISYVSLCVKMPYSCTSNFRYITYVAFSGFSLITLGVADFNKKWLHNVLYSILGIFAVSSSIFILVI